MKTARLLMIGAVTGAALTAAASNDRIDFLDAKGDIVSLMTDDIITMKVEKAAGAQTADGYSTLVVETEQGVKRYTIANMSEILYNPFTTKIPHAITFEHAENARVVLLNGYNNPSMSDPEGGGVIDPTKPYDWTGAWADFTVLFDVRPDKGYTYNFKITGDYTGKVYSDNPLFVFISEPSDNLLGVRATAFHMPFEPVNITATSRELSTYKDASFLGHYTGYAMAQPTKNRITHKAPKMIDMDFNANGTYVLRTYDDLNLGIIDLFNYDEDTNTFGYRPYEGDPKNAIDLDVHYGANGVFMEDGYMITDVHYILGDTPESTRYFIAGRDDFDFTIASADDFGFRMLMQVSPTAAGKEKKYWYLEDYCRTRREVTLDFISGSNIGWTSSAYVKDGDEILFRYDYVSGDQPEFVMRGKEAGTYTGKGGALVVDGFGKLKIGGQEASYKAEGGVLTASFAEGPRIFVIDIEGKTYTEMSNDKWTGPLSFSNGNAIGSFRGNEENDLNNITINLDTDLRGNSAPGSASVTVGFTRTDGFGNGYHTGISSIGSYIFNAESMTVTITNINLGTGPTSHGRRNLVLHVSDDLHSMWIDDSNESKLYTIDNDNSYVLTGSRNTLTAPRQGLAPEYVGEHIAGKGASTRASSSSLTIDEANGKAKLKVLFFTSAIFDQTVDYTFENSTLTLKNVSVGDGAGNITTKDIVFTLESDGSLSSTEDKLYSPAEIYETIFGYYVDLSSSNFTVPEAE